MLSVLKKCFISFTSKQFQTIETETPNDTSSVFDIADIDQSFSTLYDDISDNGQRDAINNNAVQKDGVSNDAANNLFVNAVQSSAAFNEASEASIKTCGPSKRGKKRNAAANESNSTADDQLGNYLNARAAYLQAKVAKEPKVADEDDAFGQVIANDLKRITDERVKRRIRKNISDIVYEALEEQDKQNEKDQLELAQFFLTQSQS